MRVIYCEKFNLDYWTWREQPWYIVLENMKLLYTKSISDENTAKEKKR